MSVIYRGREQIECAAPAGRGQPGVLAVGLEYGSCPTCREGRAELYAVAIAVSTFAYVLCAVGLRGVPTLSRSAPLCAACLWTVLLEGVRTRKVLLEGWLLYPLAFFTYVTLMALHARIFPLDTLNVAVSAWAGAVGVGVAMRNGVGWRIPVYAMLLAGLLSIVAHLFGVNSIVWTAEQYHPGVLRRATGLMGNANTLAISLGLPAFLVFAVRGRFPASVKCCSLFMAIYGAIVSGSRKGAALAICLVLNALLSPALKMRRFAYVYLVIVLGGLLVIAPIVINALSTSGDAVLVIERIQGVLEGEQSFVERVCLMKESYELFWQHPLFGHGLAMFAHRSVGGIYAHNNFGEVAVSGGIVAVILFYVMHVKILTYSRSWPRTEKSWLWGSVAYILLQDLATVSYIDKTIILVLMMLLAGTYPSRDGGGGTPCQENSSDRLMME